MPNKTRIILASSSPRRADLLARAGLKARVVVPGTDETALRRESPRAMVARLAREKAHAVAERIRARRVPGLRAGASLLIIAADTTVVAPGGGALGKPRDAAEARRMLARLSGRSHTVLTGYCVLRLPDSRAVARVVSTRVSMRKLTPRDIAAYVRTGEPIDKAGAYGAQGVGMALIAEIRGSYSNVVGLPLCQLLEDLEREFGVGLLPRGGPARR